MSARESILVVFAATAFGLVLSNAAMLAVRAVEAVAGEAIAAAAPQGAACPAVVVDYTFHDYDGPTRIVSCGTWAYTGGTLVVHAFDAEADGLFRNGFDQLEE